VKKRIFLSLPPLVPVCLSLITGILVGNFFPDVSWGIFASGSLCFLILSSFFSLQSTSFVKGLSFIALVWGFFSITMVLNPGAPSNAISQFANSSKYTITGEIVSFSKDYFLKQRVVLSCHLVEREGMVPVKVQGLINLNIYDKKKGSFQYGDIIEFTSPIKPIRNFANPNGFDYEKHMKFAGVSGSAYATAGKIRVIPHPMDVHIKIMRGLEQLRNRFFYFTMDKMENKRAGAILAALVTGKKEAISLKLKDLFSRAGTSHLLAISGLHLSIVAMGCFFIFYTLLACFPRLLMTGVAKKAAGILTLIPLFLYGIFSGFSPSTQRAFIMICIFMIAFLSERENNPLNTLALAAVVILTIDSCALFAISFQLSFGALLSILIGFSIIKIRGWNPGAGIMALILTPALVSFFAGLGTFPLIAHYFNLVSYVQIVSNLLLVPLVGFVSLPLGLLAFLFFPVSPGLAEALVVVCQSILSVCITYIEFLTRFKFSWSRIIGIDGVEVIILYLFLGAICLIISRQRKTGFVLMSMAVLAGSFCFGTGFKTRMFPQKMTITILDVGQGNSALIQTIEGKNILVDGGGFSSRSSFDIGRYVVGPFLWSQKILYLDAVILTHPESDHMNGLLYILENFKVNLLIKNQDTRSIRTYGELMALCHDKKIRIWSPAQGDAMLDFDRTLFVFFTDLAEPSHQNLNNNSLVFQVRFNRVTLLFPGDIHRERELILARKKERKLKSSLLISPHHGSLTSSSKIFLDKVKPESVIISCGAGNPYGFPHPDVLERYRKRGYTVFRTDINGALTISSDGIDTNILTFKGG
jgi:competence protein ComEC